VLPRRTARLGFASRRGLLVTLILGFTLLLLVLREHAAVDGYDEGAILQGAERIAHGAVPYRDFQTVYAPGQFYEVALAFRVFGTSVLTERMVDAVSRLALVAVVFLLMERLASRRVAVVGALVAAAEIAYVGNYGYPAYPALTCALLTCLCLLRYAESGRRRAVFAAGVCAGATTLFRLDFAAYLVPAAVGTLGLHVAADLKSQRLGADKVIRAWIAITAPFGAGLLAVVVVPAALLLRAVPFSTLRFDLVTFPATTLQQMYALPHPTPWADLRALVLFEGLPSMRSQFFHLLFYAPLAMLALEFVLLARMWRRGAVEKARVEWAQRVFLVLLGAALIRQELGRFDEVHALPAGLCALILFVRFLDAGRPWSRKARFHSLTTLGLGWCTTVYLMLPLTSIVATAISPPWDCLSPVERASCARLDPGQVAALEYVSATTNPDDAVFVTNARNDRGIASDVAFSMLAERRNPSAHMQFEPGLSNTVEVQQQQVASLVQGDVHVVVVVNTLEPHEANASRLSSGVTLLDDYIRAHYSTAFTAGAYSVLVRSP
jgi:hypothetical protein